MITLRFLKQDKNLLPRYLEKNLESSKRHLLKQKEIGEYNRMLHELLNMDCSF